MYATINLPGSSHFEMFGPASRLECEQWLRQTVARRQRTELATSLLPQRIISNREAESWRFRDGSRVCHKAAGREALDDCPECGFPEGSHDYLCGAVPEDFI